MARIKFYKNMFEEDYSEFEYNKDKSLLEHIEDYGLESVYTDFFVECYDSETGETTLVPFVDDKLSSSVLIQVNGIVVPSDYKVKDKDLVTIVFLPLGENYDPNTMNIVQTIVGGVLFAAGVIMCLFPATAPLGMALLGSGLGIALSGVGGLLAHAQQQNAKHTSSGLETGASSPDIRGATNSLITGNPYPFVIGKHLITPFIVGAPYTVYSGSKGEDAYIHVMYCLGYGPVAVSDLKLDEFILTKNSQNLIAGTFTDIDKYWNENKIDIELIQNQPNFIGSSRIYPSVVVQEEVNANVLHIADSSISDIADVVYKGSAFINGYRTNTVVFTEACPKEFTVILDAPSGLYKSRNETKKIENDTESKTVYSSIPLYYAIQWRFYDETKSSSKKDGSDFDDWNTITTWNGKDCSVLLTDEKIQEDQDAHEGNSYSKDVYDNFKNKVVCDFQSFSGADYLSEVRLYSTISISKEQAQSIIKQGGPNTIKSIEVRALRVSPCYIDQKQVTNTGNESSNGTWSYSDIIKFHSISTTTFDEMELKDNNNYIAESVQSKKDFNKFSYIAFKAKADANGTLQGQLNSFNCVVQSFSPVWDTGEKKWLPEDVKRETSYYGYGELLNSQPEDWSSSYENYLQIYDGKFVKNTSSGFIQNAIYKPMDMSHKYVERLVDKATYEDFRQKGHQWHCWQKGSNYVEKIRQEIFKEPVNNNYYLPNSASKFLTNYSASGFLLACVGPQNGPIAFGYDEINLLSLTDWYENSLSVADGSKDNNNNLVEIDFCANGYVYERLKLEDLLKQIAFTGRATYTYDETGKIKIIMDKAIDYPDGVINQQNCKEFTVSYNYNPLPAGLRIGFNDENDGYINSSFFCWNDGNTEKNYKGQVESYQIPFATNPRQCWSLGRYLLAVRSFSKEVVTAKMGIANNLYSLGDVVAVQSDELLIGSGNGRIQGIIEENGIIYGFILDSTYEYYGEVDKDGKCTQGISVFQPKKYGKSRVVTLRLANNGYSVAGYTLKKGITNVILLEVPVPRDFSNDPSDGNLKYDFKTGDICLIGFIEVIYSRYRITKVKPDKNNSVSYTLINYDESFYNYGEKLPVFKKNMTVPRAKRTSLTLSDVPTTIKDFNDKIIGNKDKIPSSTPLPPAPIIYSVIAARDGLTINSNKDDIPYYSKFVIEISKNNGETFSQKHTLYDEIMYPFDRDKDGYPEKEDFSSWKIRGYVENTFGNKSELSNEVGITTNEYGTWIPPRITSVKLSAHELELNYYWTTIPYHTDNRIFYGNCIYDVTLKYNEDERAVQEVYEKFSEYKFNRNIDGYPETDEMFEKYNDTQPSDLTTLLRNYNVSVRPRDTISGNKTDVEISVDIDTSDYKTWYVETPLVDVSASSRAISLRIKKANDNYGVNTFHIGIKLPVDSVYFRPFTEYTDINGNEITPYTSVLNYRENREDYSKYDFKTQTYGLYTQIVPLAGQNRFLIVNEKIKEENTEDGKIISVVYQKTEDSETSETNWQEVKRENNAGLIRTVYSKEITEEEYELLDAEEIEYNLETPTPSPTTYQFCVYVSNEAHSGYSHYKNQGLTATAQSTGARDVTANSITNNKLADGCVTADKIHAGTITADQMAATDLSTAGVTVGKISGQGLNVQGDFSNQSNFWSLEDGNEEFRVGNDREFESKDGTPKNSNAAYIHYKKDKTTGAGQLFIALSKFFVSSVASIIKGLFKIQSNSGDDFIKVNPEASSNTTETISAKTMQVKGNVEVSTKTTTNTLTITSGNDVDFDTFGTEPLSIGSASGLSIGIDNNKILARNNGKKSPLYLGGEFIWLNDNGGDIHLGSPGSSKIYGDVMTTSYVDSTNYPVMGVNQDYEGFVRIPKAGIIPYTQNGTKGYGSVGTSSWSFLDMYSKTFHGQLDGVATAAKNMYTQQINLSSYSTSNFYPLRLGSTSDFVEIAIHSQSGMASIPYNQNRIHFEFSSQGWYDTPSSLFVKEWKVFTSEEITIGSICRGQCDGEKVIYLRGGIIYSVWSRNCNPQIYTNGFTNGAEKFTVGTSYSGGSNSSVEVVFTPASSPYGVYISNKLKVGGGIFGNLEGSASKINGYSVTISGSTITFTKE